MEREGWSDRPPSVGRITQQEGPLESSRRAVLPAPAAVGGPHLLARPEHLLRKGLLRVYDRGLTHHINMDIQFESPNPSQGQIPGVLECFWKSHSFSQTEGMLGAEDSLLS